MLPSHGTAELDDAILGSYPDVDRHSCQLLGPTALVCPSNGLPLAHRATNNSLRSCKVYWESLFSYRWFTKGIEKHINGHGQSGAFRVL